MQSFQNVNLKRGDVNEMVFRDNWYKSNQTMVRRISIYDIAG